MFIVDCPTCDQRHLLSNHHIESLHKTSHGIVGYVRCAAGHVVLHQFPVATAGSHPRGNGARTSGSGPMSTGVTASG